MVTDADAVVPFGPITSTGNVTVAADVPEPEPDEAGVRVTLDVAVLVGSATLVAVTVTVWPLLTVAGAVYTPFTSVPTAGLIVHVTAVLLVPVTDAVNVADLLAASDAEGGPTVTPIGCNDIVALAVFVESATLVAVTVTVCWLAIIAGAS
jgi:hypothetical protein